MRATKAMIIGLTVAAELRYMKLPSMAIDLGSSNTRMYQLGTGVVLEEPSYIVVEGKQKKSVRAVGYDAKNLIGRTGDGTIVGSPIREGYVNDEALATDMLERFLNKVTLKKLGKRPPVLFSVPCGAENAIIKKYEKVLNGCGVYDCFFIESPVLTALGAGVPLTESTPCFLIDVGGGSTKIAAVSLGGVISGVSVNIGGEAIDRMLCTHIEDLFGLKIGMLTAEKMKIQIGGLLEHDQTEMIVNGRDIDSGRPRACAVRSCDIYQPIKLFFDKIFRISDMLMAKLPAEISADIRRAGVYFAGGGANFAGLDQYFRYNEGMRANVCERPELATILGAGKVCGDRKLLSTLDLKRSV